MYGCKTKFSFFKFTLILAIAKLDLVIGAGESATCSMEMYGNDSAAYWACATQFAHQSNWFPSPIAGLFSYQIWNGYDGFWQNGVILETMVNFVAFTDNTNFRYLSVIKGGERDLYSLLEAYGPYPSFDDMGWYGLAYARIHEVIAADLFLQDATDIFNWAWQTGWDQSGTCNGGYWFDNNFGSKQTITNVQFLQLAAKMYRITGNEDFHTKMGQIYNFILNNSIINESTYLISDGVNANCTPENEYGPTYNSGVMIGALVEMFKVTNDSSHIDLAIKIAHAVLEKSCDPNGILVEYCEPNCDKDALMFKGIFVRNLRYLMDVLNDKAKRAYFQSWIDLQVESNLLNNMCDLVPITKCNISFQDGPPYYNISGPVFSYDWRGPFKYGAPMQQSSTLDLLISAILPGTKCHGDFCSYDPYYPPPQPLTCRSRPCPQGQDCCEYSPYTSYTCCATGQHCNTTTGICV